jgi:tetratricopeptide (TPR) repeat protein
MYYNISIYLANLERYGEAIDYMLMCIEVDEIVCSNEEVADDYEMLANLYDDFGEHEKAKECYKKAKQLRGE